MFARWDYNLRGGLGAQPFIKQSLAFQLSAGHRDPMDSGSCARRSSVAGAPMAPSGYTPLHNPAVDPRSQTGDMRRMPGGRWGPPTCGEPKVIAPSSGGFERPLSQAPTDGASRLDTSATMTGGRGNAIRFGAGNDRLSVTGGQDHMAIMGAGNDRVSLENTSNVTIDAGAGNDLITGTAVRGAWIDPGEGRNSVAISGEGIRIDASRGSNMILLAGEDSHVEGAGADDFIVRLTRGWDGFRFG
jgi:hypothetical protein